jgi:hypothetical protein
MPPIDWGVVIGIAGAVVGGLSWITSASKSRVDNLCQIVDVQAARIRTLTTRIEELEEENRFYRMVIDAEGVDLCQYERVDFGA